jgi:hypothetical protein
MRAPHARSGSPLSSCRGNISTNAATWAPRRILPPSRRKQQGTRPARETTKIRSAGQLRTSTVRMRNQQDLGDGKPMLCGLSRFRSKHGDTSYHLALYSSCVKTSIRAPHSSQRRPRSSSISEKGSARTLADLAYTPRTTHLPGSNRKTSRVLRIGSMSQAYDTWC